ncbi:MAG: hypothetical protein M0Z58_01100, partial [Nitrospiraceae bacterium]|nr:hypothetical protein [Nitrospiraceae bacterium]
AGGGLKKQKYIDNYVSNHLLFRNFEFPVKFEFRQFPGGKEGDKSSPEGSPESVDESAGEIRGKTVLLFG